MYARRRFGRLTVAWALWVAVVWTVAALVGQRPTSDEDHRANAVRSPAKVLAAWDGSIYVSLADSGYRTEGEGQRHFVFFPLYPALTHLASAGTNVTVAGILVAQLAFLVAMCVVSVYARGAEPTPLRRDPAIWLLLAPVGFFFFAMYTESLFLLLTVGSALAFSRRRFAVTFALGYLAGLTRPTAITLSVPFFVAAVIAWRKGDRWLPPLACSSAPALGIATYVFGVGVLFDDPLAYTRLQSTHWDYALRLPFLTTARDAFDTAYGIKNGIPVPGWQVLRMSTLAVAGGLLVWGWKRIPLPWLAYVVASLMFIHASDPGRSTVRYELVLFPVFMLAAMSVLAKRSVAPFVLAASAATQLYFLVQFGQWRWVG